MKIDSNISGNHTISGIPICEDETGRVVAVFYNDYDAKEVAHAINYHDELVSTLEEALSMIERQPDFNDDGDGLLISRCKQALAKARGEL